MEGGVSEEGIEKKNREREGPLSETTAEICDTYFFRMYALKWGDCHSMFNFLKKYHNTMYIKPESYGH